jgi:serine/threonine-protein kinase
VALFDLGGEKDDAPASTPQVRAGGLQPGDVLDGKYRIERLVGEGGMGQVLAATHLGLGQQVAIKIMLAEKATDTDSVERFLREARAVVMLKSSHIARVFDVAKTPAGLPYIVMELLDGKDLVTVLLESGALPYSDAVEVILQACDALAEAHALGIIHRDLKPENFFLSRRRDGTPHVKLIDFGISKLGIEANNRSGRRVVTQENTVLGSPTYMSPEQVRNSKSVDERSDIWSIGVSLYELLTAAEPFGAESIPEIFVNVLTVTPPSPDTIVAEIPADLAAIVMRCIAKDPNARFQNVGELASALFRFGAGKPTSVAPTWGETSNDKSPDSQSSLITRLGPQTNPGFKVPGLPGLSQSQPIASSPAPMSVSATIAETPAKSSRGRVVAISLAVVVLLSAGGAGAWWKLRHTHAADTAQSTAPSAAVAAAPPVETTPAPEPSSVASSAPAVASASSASSAPAAKSSAVARPGRPGTKPVTAPRTGTPTTAAPKASGLPRERTSW